MKLFNYAPSNYIFYGLYIFCGLIFCSLGVKHYYLEGFNAIIEGYSNYLMVFIAGHVFMAIPYTIFKILDEDPNVEPIFSNVRKS